MTGDPGSPHGTTLQNTAQGKQLLCCETNSKKKKKSDTAKPIDELKLKRQVYR